MKGTTSNPCNPQLFRFGLSVVLLLCAGVLQAQNGGGCNSNSGCTPTAVDPGPRPTGNQVKNHNGVKFTNVVADSAQPTDGVNAGAGNVLANTLVGTGANQVNFGAFWGQALSVFGTTATVNGAASGTSGTILGLGPSFNSQSCLECHSQPAIGGSSPGCVTPAGKPTLCSNTGNVAFTENPQIIDAHALGANNSVPSFINPEGPVREARFPKTVPATGFAAAIPAGSVANLFVIQGRSDEPPNCKIDQIDFQTQQTNNNVVFRIPIPLFGEGFVENTPDAALRANAAAAANLSANTPTGARPAHGISGSFNTSANDQTVSRFGWKAQNKSLLIFAGEASNVEMGVTNENFTNERTIGNGLCISNTQPEDITNVLTNAVIAANSTNGPNISTLVSSDIEDFAVFMRLNGAPSQCDFASTVDSTGAAVCNILSTSATNGKALFGTMVPGPAGGAPNYGIGCVLCHADSFTTSSSLIPSLNNATFHPLSDFALHHMGVFLADGVTRGAAGPDQFRTAPLWGIGQRLFFLHDGRETDIVQAIEDHCPSASSVASGSIPASEACGVIANFNALGQSDQQAVVNFLRSL
ncbi:MAG TPA: di-heme oxidoredictase family protein [Candidatus Angelobacter sp.]